MSLARESDQPELTVVLPEAGTLRVVPGPHWRMMPGLLPITIVFALAAGATAASGVVLFGWYSIRVLAISVAVALLAESGFNALRGRSPSWSEGHALLIGLLFGCTLPPDVSWRVVATGALVAVLVGDALAGGVGNYLWHPVALGRVVVQLVFDDELSPVRRPVLAPDHLLWGDLGRAQALPTLGTWGSSTPSGAGVQAWLVEPTEHLLRETLPRSGDDPASALAAFVRDLAPPWLDTLTGVAGGGIGEAAVVVVLLAGCLLLWRGLLRWSLLLGAIGTAMVTAAILPVTTTEAGLRAMPCPLPGLVLWDGLPVGAGYVLYHLTAGGFLFVVLLLAPDPTSSPLTARGHLAFGCIIGATTMLLRVGLGVPAAAYWALLAANAMVPIINRLTRRRVLGT